MDKEKLINKTTEKYLPWLAAMAIFMQALDATILNTALPSIAADLNHSPLQLQSVIVSYTLTVALLIPLSGWLSDKFGTQNIFRIAVVLFALGSLCCALSTSLTELILSRILQAVGGSMMVPVARLAILYAYPKKDLLKVINFITIPGLVGLLLGPSVGGVLVELASWHWIFLINVPIGILVIWLAKFALPNFKRTVKRFDTLGLILFSGGLTLLTLTMELSSLKSVSKTNLIFIFCAAFALISFYIYHAKRVKNPLINLNIFKIRTLRIGLIGSITTRLGIGGMPLLIPLMLQVGYGYSAMIAGLMMIPSAASNIFAKSFVVPLVNKLGYRSILISNTLLLGFLISLFYFLKSDTPIYYIIPLMMMHGIISSIQFTSMNTIALADLTESTSSEGNSLQAVTQQLSVSFGISVASMVLLFFRDQSAGGVNETGVDIFRYTFLVLGVLTMFSVVVFFGLKPTDGENMSGRK